MAKHRLEYYFAIDPSPDTSLLVEFAEELHFSYEVVRTWFCNRRQKKRRIDYEAKVNFPEAAILNKSTSHFEEEVNGTFPGNAVISSQDSLSNS
ncbi:unnamed protein product [Strongylus vulgaris]|uniref:Homeobox domain-containing protein n=1 Tax=Strongylus vulgaris TaxID=40348 RepID=A0A3P7J6Q5_STRVU|nr:unnamed protein product [Strongylus vulgaris]